MFADVLRQTNINPLTDEVGPTDEAGEWANQQDPDSGEIIRIWQAYNQVDNLLTTGVDETLETFRCQARAIVDGGIRVAGTTERFDSLYDNVDYVQITFPTSVRISRRDRITNIRDRKGNVIWKEYDQPEEPPTVFNVNGVSHIIAPLIGHTENKALLSRAERQ